MNTAWFTPAYREAEIPMEGAPVRNEVLFTYQRERNSYQDLCFLRRRIEEEAAQRGLRVYEFEVRSPETNTDLSSEVFSYHRDFVGGYGIPRALVMWTNKLVPYVRHCTTKKYYRVKPYDMVMIDNINFEHRAHHRFKRSDHRWFLRAMLS